MSHLTKLMVAAGLGLAAAVGNMVWLSAQAKPTLFVAVAEPIEPGEPMAEAKLKPVPVPGDVRRLRATLIPWQGRATVLDYPAPRPFAGGDLVFRQDIRPPSQRLSIVGPFRVVGDSERSGQDARDETLRRRDDIVILAVGADLDERTRALLQLLAPHQERQAVARSIVAVQIVPQAPTDAAAAGPDVVYQPVDMGSLDNAPQDLQAGEFVRFVVSE